MKKTNITFIHIYTNKQTNQEALEKIITVYLNKELLKKIDKIKQLR